MLLTPKGGSHRDLLPDQVNLGISASGGALVSTEARTRDFTDSWKKNLLRQKKPNANGIQCYDPRLNRDIIEHMGKEYEKHLKLEATSPKKSGARIGCVNESSGGFGGNPLLLPALEGHHVEPGSGDVFRYPESRKPPHESDSRRRMAEVLTPPALNNGSPSNERSLGTLEYIETGVPKPLSPSSVAQKLRRYKIGLSPQQKVKNLIDDMRIGEMHSKGIDKNKLQGGEGTAKNNEGTAQQSPFHENESFWDESDPGQAKQFDGGTAIYGGGGGLEGGRTRPKISDGMYEEMKNVFPHLNRSQLDQLSNEDFLFLRQALAEQGFIAEKNNQSDLVEEGGSVGGVGFENDGIKAVETCADEMQTAPSFTDSTLPGNLSQRRDGGTGVDSGAVAANAGILLVDADDNLDDGFIYEDESPEPDMPESEIPQKQANNVGVKTIDGLQIGVGFDEEYSHDDCKISASYSNSSYENSIADFHSQHQRENHQAIGMDRHPSVTDGPTSELDKSKMGEIYSPVAGSGGNMKRGANKLPPFKWTEAESRDNLGYLRKARRQPRCYNCSKDGELWCDHCRKVTCYNCWGIEDHHNTWEASVAFAADQGRLEKVQTMRGAGVIDSRKKAMEKTMLKVMSPGAKYSLLSGHNVDARKKAMDPDAAMSFTYTPKASFDGTRDPPMKRQGTPKATLVDSDEQISDKGMPNMRAYPSESTSGVDLFLTGLNAFSYVDKSEHGDTKEEKDADSPRHTARMTLSARVPSGANTDNEDEVGDTAPAPCRENENLDEGSLQLTHDDSADGGGDDVNKMSDDISAMSSPIRRPLTAMTDNIPDVEDGDSMPFDSISPSYGSRYSDSQPIVSAVNADQLYYKNAMTPKAHQKTGDIQRHLNDNYIEFDEMNMIHYSPAKKDPVRMAHLEGIYKDRIHITAERTKGYGQMVKKQRERALHLSHKAKRLVHDVLAAKKKVLATTRQFDLEEGDITFKIGKKSERLPLHVPITSNATEDAVEAFSVSPLNKKLIVPEVNADGTATRRPPDPKEVFFKEKAKKEKVAKRQLKSFARREDMLSPVGLSNDSDDDGAISEYGEDDDEEVSKMYDNLQNEGMLESRLNTGGSAARRSSKDGSELASEAVSSDTSSKKSGVGSATEWGWNQMRGRSAKHGNFPSLPFRGPPYIFDMDADEHENTVHRVYSPQEQNRTINKLTSLW